MADTNDVEILEADEILDADAPRPAPEPVHVTALTRPFNFERTQLDVTGQHTIAELLAMAGIPRGVSTLVYLNGYLVPERGYKYTRPKPGTHVLVRVVPQGGGHTGGILKTVAGVVLIVVGILLSLGTEGLATPGAIPLISFGVSLVISGLVNLLIPPTTPPRLRALSGTDNAAALSPALAIGGGKNALRAYGKVPRVIGRDLMFPPSDAVEGP
jgi:hypothetical protein